jgi:AraC family transcriptional regulator
MPIVRSLRLPWLKIEYDRAAGARDGFAVTRSGAVGVAFTGQTDAAWSLDRQSARRQAYPPASVFIVGGCDLTWHRWGEPSEALELWLDETWLARIGAPEFRFARVEPRTPAEDTILVSVASSFRRMLMTNQIDELKLESIAVVAAERLLRAYAGLPIASRRSIRPLDAVHLRRIDSYIRDHLAVPFRLEDLAREVAASPFHFAKRFRAATGAAPHQYVVARRMERALDLLRRSRCTVAEVAAAVGYRQVGHFRRQFRAHWGQSPGLLAAEAVSRR